MIVSVRIDSGEPVQVGDLLEHAQDRTTRRQESPTITRSSFARVVDPTPGERSANGAYWCKCELLLQVRYDPKAKGNKWHDEQH